MSNYAVYEEESVDELWDEEVEQEMDVAQGDPSRARIPADARCLINPKGNFQVSL